MKKILISVIIPVYNVTKYINKCLESVINQTYKNLEIILVDDGSTDDSGKICDEYAKNDKRIKVIHKENGGLSSARNVGIDNSKGDYLYFIDSDDYIKLDFLERLLNDCINNKCEISVCNDILVFDNKEVPNHRIKKCEKLNPKETLKHVYMIGNFVAWNKLYKRNVFDGVRFPDGKLFEDIATIPFVILKAKNIYLDNYFVYYYYQRNNSIMNSKVSVNKMDYIYNNLYVYDKIIKDYPELESAYNTNYLRALIGSIDIFYSERKSYKKEYKFLLDELKKNKKNYLRNNNLSKKFKLKIFIYSNHLSFVSGMFKKIKKVTNKQEKIND